MTGFEECFVSGTGAEVTPVSGAGLYKFTPGAMSRALIGSAEVRPKQKAAEAGLEIAGLAVSRRTPSTRS